MIPATAASPRTALTTLWRSLARATLLMVALTSLPLAAQSPQQPPAKPAEQPASQPQEEGPDAQASEPAPGEAATGAAALPESEDPFDYEASEQISEDLSVSFPVDI